MKTMWETLQRANWNQGQITLAIQWEAYMKNNLGM